MQLHLVSNSQRRLTGAARYAGTNTYKGVQSTSIVSVLAQTIDESHVSKTNKIN